MFENMFCIDEFCLQWARICLDNFAGSLKAFFTLRTFEKFLAIRTLNVTFELSV